MPKITLKVASGMFSLSIDDIENSQQCFTTLVLKIADAGWLILLVKKFLRKKGIYFKNCLNAISQQYCYFINDY